MANVRRVELQRPFEEGGVVAVGWYDGLHRGHRAALEHLRTVADQRGTTTGLVLIDDDRNERQLTSVEQRLHLIEETGLVDTVWVVDAPVDDWSGHAPAFIRDVLLTTTGAGAVLTTTGAGQGPMVQAFGQQLVDVATEGDLAIVPLDDAQREWNDLDRSCSSADVAALLDRGDVAEAAKLLGRHHEMRGRVELGDQRGRTLGFPTANVAMPVSFVIPREAVYAGLITPGDGITRATAISLGRRPTFYPDGLTLLEAHVLDFSGDLYGQDVRVRFVDKVRDQRRFDGPDALAAQLRRDIETTRDLIAPML
ncbi:MAG: riboflavin kinase [Ilumatobacter sp.]|uniref:riboflavin kinase n=1 Tax=Ilumatobacter sp. TaxID=1967498 RepID=UPI00391AD649